MINRLKLFKKGDILYARFRNEYIFIFDKYTSEGIYKICSFETNLNFFSRHTYLSRDLPKEIRYATDEEKSLLFNEMKSQHYVWNDETFLLEELKSENVMENKIVELIKLSFSRNEITNILNLLYDDEIDVELFKNKIDKIEDI
jgi:hypothetical protein